MNADRPRVTLGADGWRGLIGEGFTEDAAALVGAATAQVLAVRGARTILISHDARRLSDASALAVAAAVAPWLRPTIVAHLPTPVATSQLMQENFDAAILITASHNPANWNGVKVRVAPGVPVDTHVEAEIDRRIDESRGMIGTPAEGTAARTQAAERFFSCHAERILTIVEGMAVPPARVVVDGLHGIAGPPIAAICQALGWKTLELGSVPDPSFRGFVPDPVLSQSRSRAADSIRQTRADLGIVLDGDGDRIWVLDHNGNSLPPAVLFALLLEEEARNRECRLPVAVTVSCGAALVPVCAALRIPVIERPVGFKHIAPLLATGKIIAGAGGVGDVAFAPYSFDRDPAVVVALLARLLRHAGTARLNDLVKQFTDRYGWLHREERHVSDAPSQLDATAVCRAVLERVGLSADVLGVTKIDGVKFSLKGDAWVLLRKSSTEGGVRIFTETRDAALSQIIADTFEEIVRVK